MDSFASMTLEEVEAAIQARIKARPFFRAQIDLEQCDKEIAELRRLRRARLQYPEERKRQPRAVVVKKTGRSCAGTISKEQAAAINRSSAARKCENELLEELVTLGRDDTVRGEILKKQLEYMAKPVVPNGIYDVYTEEALASAINDFDDDQVELLHDEAEQLHKLAEDYYNAGRRIGKDFSGALTSMAKERATRQTGGTESGKDQIMRRKGDLLRKTRQQLSNVSPEKEFPELAEPVPVGKIMAIGFGIVGIVCQLACWFTGAPPMAGLLFGAGSIGAMMLCWGASLIGERGHRRAVADVCFDRLEELQERFSAKLEAENDEIYMTACSERQFIKGGQTQFVVAIDDLKHLTSCPSSQRYSVEGGRFMEDGTYLAVQDPVHLRFVCSHCDH